MYYCLTDVERIEHLERQVDSWTYLERLNWSMWDGERFQGEKREFIGTLKRPFGMKLPKQTKEEAVAEAQQLLAYVDSKKGGWKTEVNGKVVDILTPG